LFNREHTDIKDKELIFRDLLSTGRSTMLALGKESDPICEFALSTAAGLEKTPRLLESRFLYDARGSEIYENICAQPEYYLTRTEASMLDRFAAQISRITGSVTLLELGSGNSAKMDSLFREFLEQSSRIRYLPVDVSSSALRQAGKDIRRKFPDVHVIGIHSTYEKMFPLLSCFSPSLILFLGSTIGNLDEQETIRFFSRMTRQMEDGDFFLLGIDLVKDPALLEAAYNDAAGVTREFTRNLFVRMNRELGSGIDLETVEHEAKYNPDLRRIEIAARFDRGQQIRISPLGRTFSVRSGEKIRTEISRKFVLDEMPPFLSAFGLELREVFTDEKKWFGLLLLQKTRPSTLKPIYDA